MLDEGAYQAALNKLKDSFPKLKTWDEKDPIDKARDTVLGAYQRVFSYENIGNLKEEEIKSFLLPKNNHHWSGLSRHNSQLCSDMPNLRNSLRYLLDETKPIEDRIDYISNVNNANHVFGLGRAIFTAILLVAHPEKYGVWNNATENALKDLGVWPEFEWGTSTGKKYVILNNLFNRFAKDLNIDLWKLDNLFWVLNIDSPEVLPEPVEEMEGSDDVEDGDVEDKQGFGLERHLEDYLIDNWGKIPLGKEWNIYNEDGDDFAGQQYKCDLGIIDILAHHKTRPEWLVIELKKNQSSDNTVGQILRYMGWVKKKLAKNGDTVKGLIIARQGDKAIQYALSLMPGVELQLYEVEFKLKPIDNLDES